MRHVKEAPRRRHQVIALELEHAISTGTYPPGSRLPAERELAEQLSVSRPVLNQAMLVLELKGLVEIRHGAGVFVTRRDPSAAAVEPHANAGPFEMTEARRLLEGEVAALAATSATDRQLDEMERIVARIADMRQDNQTREQADRAFHVALARATDNEVLVSMIERLWDMRYHSPLCVYFFTRAREVGIEPPADEHKLVLDALRRRDPEGARQAMRDHLARVTEKLVMATEADAMDRARLKVSERRFDFARRAGVAVQAG